MGNLKEIIIPNGSEEKFNKSLNGIDLRFMDYELKLLKRYADLMIRNKITPEILINANECIKYGYELAIKEYQEQSQKALDEVLKKWK